jgi:NAD+ kinase
VTGKPIQAVGILTKPKFPEVKTTLTNLSAWLRHRGVTPLLDAATASLISEAGPPQKSDIAAQADLLVVLGGDGTMLSAARLAETRGIPILGVNMGGLGFLTEVRPDLLYQSLDRVFAGDFLLDERLMLRAAIHRRGDTVAQAAVLNDVVVSKGTLARMIEISINLQKQFVTRLRGDGVIVSTPTGSTAYSLSAGGPIMNPSVHALLLTPICPHTLTHRPLMVPSSVEVEGTLLSKDEGAMATLDGQVGVPLTQGDTVTLTASEHQTRLIRFPESSYYHVLREKLKWGDG